MLATIGILSALHKRTQTGEGSHVQISLLEAAYALMPNYVVSVLNGEPNYTRQGSGHPQLVPYQAFKAADGKYVVVGAFHRASWRALCAAIKREDLVANPMFKENSDRVENRPELMKILEAEMLQRTSAEWVKIFKEHNVLAAPVLTIKESLGTFEKLIDGLVVTTEHSKLGKLKEVRCPIIFDSKPSSQQRAAPTLGEHTMERLSKRGFSDQELQRWRAQKII